MAARRSTAARAVACGSRKAASTPSKAAASAVDRLGQFPAQAFGLVQDFVHLLLRPRRTFSCRSSGGPPWPPARRPSPRPARRPSRRPGWGWQPPGRPGSASGMGVGGVATCGQLPFQDLLGLESVQLQVLDGRVDQSLLRDQPDQFAVVDFRTVAAWLRCGWPPPRFSWRSGGSLSGSSRPAPGLPPASQAP